MKPKHTSHEAAGAYMIGVPDSIDPQPHSSTFWKALPGGKGLFWPMFIIATLAAIVASQALISAVCQQCSEGHRLVYVHVLCKAMKPPHAACMYWRGRHQVTVCLLARLYAGAT